MKKLFMLVLLAVLAACGTLEQSSEEFGEVSSQGVTMCQIPCCGNSVTFYQPGCNGTIYPAGPNVPVNETIRVRFYEAQTPGSIRLLLTKSSGVGVSCNWVWSSDNTIATCTPQGAVLAVIPGLDYGTTYTTTVQRWSNRLTRAGMVGYWLTLGSATFTTQYLVNSQ